MSKYRPIHKKIWNDKDFKKSSKDEKLLFLYFSTCEATNNSGIYEIPLSTISEQTAINLLSVKKILQKGSIKNIEYDMENEVVFVVNARKYSPGGKPDLVEKGILSEYKENSKTYLWTSFLEKNPQFKHLYNGWTTVAQPLVNGSIQIPIEVEVEVEDLTNNNPLKMEAETGVVNLNFSTWFDEDWKDYPKGGNKQKAKAYYLKTVKSEQIREEFRFKSAEYLNSVDDPKYIKNGDTWFCNWDKYETKKPLPRNSQNKTTDQILNIINSGGDENGNRPADKRGLDFIDIGGVSPGDAREHHIEGMERIV